LLQIIEECRQNVPMIRRYTKDVPDAFLKRVELRSSLVVEAGHVAEGGKTVPFYQFRHLTFQEYLAAVAAVEGHHQGYAQGETLLEPLGDVIIAEEWKEVIPMAAVLGRKQAQPLIAELVSRSEAVKQEYLINGSFSVKDEWSAKLPAPVSRLVQCLIEEAEVPQEILGQALSLVSFFARGSRGPENWEALSRGPYGKELIHRALTIYMEMNWRREMQLDSTVALLSALSRPLPEWFSEQGIRELRGSMADNDEKSAALALLTVCGLLWLLEEKSEKSEEFRIFLPFLPQIEEHVMSSTESIIEAASWALGLIYHRADREGVTLSPPSHSVLDHLTSLLLGNSNRRDRMTTLALTIVLQSPRGTWKPRLTASARSTLRSYFDEPDNFYYGPVAAGLIGFHAGDVFTDRELRDLITLRKTNFLIGDRFKSMLKSISVGPRERAARRPSRSRKSA
jgi:hypothetical protein